MRGSGRRGRDKMGWFVGGRYIIPKTVFYAHPERISAKSTNGPGTSSSVLADWRLEVAVRALGYWTYHSICMQP